MKLPSSIPVCCVPANRKELYLHVTSRVSSKEHCFVRHQRFIVISRSKARLACLKSSVNLFLLRGTTLSYLFLLPAPLLQQCLLYVLSCPSTASTCFTHEVENSFLLSPIREPTVADDDSKSGCESGNDEVVADCDADEVTHI